LSTARDIFKLAELVNASFGVRRLAAHYIYASCILRIVARDEVGLLRRQDLPEFQPAFITIPAIARTMGTSNNKHNELEDIHGHEQRRICTPAISNKNVSPN
jgi:hypothetical protein